MTKSAATFLLFFVVVVSSSHARDLSHRSEYELSVPDSAAESDSKPSIQNFSEIESSKSTTELDQSETGSDPEFVLRFRHIGRRSVPLMYRRGFHHRHNFKRWRSYGNDMIVSDERSRPSSVEIAEFRGESEEDRKHFRHFHHFHHHGEEEHKEKSGLVRKFRKFLIQFQF